ncbi:MAG: serine--tRNA ligase [Bacteroidota bacterium]
MLDIQFIRENRSVVEKAMKAKGEQELDLVQQVLESDEVWRSKTTLLDELRAESNRKAKQIGQLMSSGEKEKAKALIDETGTMKKKVKKVEEEVRQLEEERESLLLRIPNIPHPSVPVGSTEEENEVIHQWGDPLAKEWREPHWELADAHHWIDFERGVKVAGAGFPFYLGALARLQRLLITFFLEEAVREGYLEMEPPFFVNEASARGTGQIPDKEDMMYVIPRDGFMAIPTAEVPVTNFHRDEILAPDELPRKYVAYTPCWRREAGSYGKDVRGLNRLHQFNKVELVHVVHPDHSYAELERLRSHAEGLLEKLELPYRTLLMCTGDMGFTQSKKYDLEVWSPGQERWLEVSSCSNFEAFQARRLQLRTRNEKGSPIPVHTLNGSGLALPRIVAALLETFQTEEGDVRLPEALHALAGSETLLG